MAEVLPAYDCQILPTYSRWHSLRLRPFWPSRRPAFGQGFLYRHRHLHVTLDRPMSAGKFPAYGFNGVVNGHVEIPKECDHVISLTASIEAVIETSISSTVVMSFPIFRATRTVLHTITLYSSSPSPSGSINGLYLFSIPFPTYFPGKRSMLPPSYAVNHLSASYQINYFLRVDLTRRGWRKHERLNIPILYLPKTTSTERSLETPKYSLEDDMCAGEDTAVRTVVLRSKEPSLPMPTTNLVLPAIKIFVSGEAIPLMLTFHSVELPALAYLWSQRDKISVRLIKRSRVCSRFSGYGISVKDVLISDAELLDVDSSVEGVSRSRWTVQVGNCVQKEMSWQVEGIVDVRYVVQVSIRAPYRTSVEKGTVRHEEFVKIVTDPCIEESASESLPAFGLITAGAERPICRV